MSLFNCVAIRGPQVDNGAHDRFNEELFARHHKVIRNDGCSHDFNGQLTSCSIKNINGLAVYECIIDDTLIVTNATIDQRVNNLAFWNSKKIQVLKSMVLVGMAGILGIVAATAIVPNPFVLTAIAISMFCLTLLTVRRASQVSSQIKAWQEDPMAHYQNIRRKVGVEGFPYIWRRKLKGSFVHPDEVKTAYWNWAEDFFRKFNKDDLSIEEAYQFFARNPLDKALIEYAGIECDEQWTLLVEAFNQIKSSRTNLNDQLLEVNRQKEELLQKNASNQECAINAVRAMINEKYQATAQERDGIIAAEQHVYEEKVRKINKTFDDTPQSEPGRKKACVAIRDHDLREAENELQNNPRIMEANRKFEELSAAYELGQAQLIDPINQLGQRQAEEIQDFANNLSARIRIQANANQQPSDLGPLIASITSLVRACTDPQEYKNYANQAIREPILIEAGLMIDQNSKPPFLSDFHFSCIFIHAQCRSRGMTVEEYLKTVKIEPLHLER